MIELHSPRQMRASVAALDAADPGRAEGKGVSQRGWIPFVREGAVDCVVALESEGQVLDFASCRQLEMAEGSWTDG